MAGESEGGKTEILRHHIESHRTVLGHKSAETAAEPAATWTAAASAETAARARHGEVGPARGVAINVAARELAEVHEGTALGENGIDGGDADGGLVGDDAENFFERHLDDIEGDLPFHVLVNDDGFPGLPLDFAEHVTHVGVAHVEGHEVFVRLPCLAPEPEQGEHRQYGTPDVDALFHSLFYDELRNEVVTREILWALKRTERGHSCSQQR